MITELLGVPMPLKFIREALCVVSGEETLQGKNTVQQMFNKQREKTGEY